MTSKIIDDILVYLQEHTNPKTIKHMENKGAYEETVLGVAQKDLKVLYKKYRNQHELALALFELDHLDARSLACMICDLDKMDQKQFDTWIEMTQSPWIIDYQLSVTLAGHPDAQHIAQSWIDSNEPKKVEGGYYTYCWLLGNRMDSEFSDEEISSLLYKVEKSETLSNAMAYFVEIVGISYLPLHKEAVELANSLNLSSAINGVQKAKDKGRLGFKRSYLRC